MPLNVIILVFIKIGTILKFSQKLFIPGEVNRIIWLTESIEFNQMIKFDWFGQSKSNRIGKKNVNSIGFDHYSINFDWYSINIDWYSINIDWPSIGFDWLYNKARRKKGRNLISIGQYIDFLIMAYYQFCLF